MAKAKSSESEISEADKARRWASAWKKVNDIELEEARRRTPAERVRQFFSLMELAKAMDWESSTAEELEMVRARWRKLKGGFLSGKKLERAAHGA